MISLLHGLFNMIISSFTGSWWFDSQQPLNLDPVPATITESDLDDDDDEGDDEYLVTSRNAPKCVTCGGPNFSLEKDRCIACRAQI